MFDSIEQAQAELDTWVELYNHERPRQGIGGVAPWERFRLAQPAPVEGYARPPNGAGSGPRPLPPR